MQNYSLPTGGHSTLEHSPSSQQSYSFLTKGYKHRCCSLELEFIACMSGSDGHRAFGLSEHFPLSLFAKQTRYNPKYACTCSCATWSRCTCPSNGLGLYDYQWSIPTYTTLWQVYILLLNNYKTIKTIFETNLDLSHAPELSTPEATLCKGQSTFFLKLPVAALL